ncbi:MAG: hypothetical protein HC782_02770 [Gammaproteobacteria bacterium]|nr:hypothetical protein [Gammaproteobacteria bacterium]
MTEQQGVAVRRGFRHHIGGNQSDDGREEFSCKPVNESLNSSNLLPVGMELTESDE